MVLLAITDFGLTGKGFLGDYEKTARMKRAATAQDAPRSNLRRRDQTSQHRPARRVARRGPKEGFEPPGRQDRQIK